MKDNRFLHGLLSFNIITILFTISFSTQTFSEILSILLSIKDGGIIENIDVSTFSLTVVTNRDTFKLFNVSAIVALSVVIFDLAAIIFIIISSHLAKK